MALFTIPRLKEAACESLRVRGRLLLCESAHRELLRRLKTRKKSLHASIGRSEASPDGSIAITEHFGVDRLSDQGNPSLENIKSVCAGDETPTALLHWSAQAFQASEPLPPFLEKKENFERLNDWFEALSSGFEVHVSALISYSTREYDCVVPLPLELPKERLGGFTAAQGVWLVKRQDDSAAGAAIYEAYVTQDSETINLSVEFDSVLRPTATGLDDLLSGARQISMFAVRSVSLKKIP